MLTNDLFVLHTYVSEDAVAGSIARRGRARSATYLYDARAPTPLNIDEMLRKLSYTN